MNRPQHRCSTSAFEPFPDAALAESIAHRFSRQVEIHHDCLAVLDANLAVTYGELDAWANGVAHAIAGVSGTRRDPVALLVGQGVGYAAAVLGAVKSGRPYVPLDPTDPPARLAGLTAACGARVVVADGDGPASAVAAEGGLEAIRVAEVSHTREPPAVDVRPDDVAYVFFTSGSTGTPKGVYDTHRNVLHNVLRYTNALEIRPTDRLTLLQGPAFSGCVSSQLGALLNGALSCPFRLREEGLVRAARWLRDARITIYHSVPSIFRAIAANGESFPDVRVVRLEGDRASAEDVRTWKRHFAPESILANGLGTTETGLARQLIVRRGDPARDGVLPVGYPIRDVTVTVVDEQRRPVPTGETGEIAVAGPYLALGYWRRPDLTSEKFGVRDGARTYYTGDLGRLAADGCLEYLGRKEGDHKVLGTRVEPAEVEQEILRLDGIRDAAVCIRPGPRGDGRVVAYVVADDRLDLESLRGALAGRLPRAMLPTALVQLEALPLGANGKVERRALPDAPASRPDPNELASPDESWLAEIWQEVLGVGGIGPGDDFFELGGDSLAGAEILARIETRTGRSLPLGVFLRASTVAALSEVLRDDTGRDGSVLSELRPGAEPPIVLLHDNTGSTLHYVRLVEQLTDSRALWALDYVAEDDFAVETIASRHLETLLRRQPCGPYNLVGVCYGGVVARELAVQLVARGHEVGLLALLALTPLDFPTLVVVDPDATWRPLRGPSARIRDQVRHHLRRSSGLRAPARARYVAARGANLVTRPLRRRSDVRFKVQRALLAHRPRPYHGHALVVLQELEASAYTRTPERAWAALAATVDVVVLPGARHEMLSEPNVERLAEVLREALESESELARRAPHGG